MTSPWQQSPDPEPDRPAGPPTGWGTPGWSAPPPPDAWPGQQATFDERGNPLPRPGEETLWAVGAHLSYFVAGIVVPLVIFLVKKDEVSFTRSQAVEALNFHLTVLIASLVCLPLMIVLIGIPLLLAVLGGGAVLSVLAAVASARGENYRYPLCLRLVT